MARYAVVRRAPDLPAEFDTGDLEGRWFDLDEVKQGGVSFPANGPDGGAVAVRTDRYEEREDGARARVYEIRP